MVAYLSLDITLLLKARSFPWATFSENWSVLVTNHVHGEIRAYKRAKWIGGSDFI